jgi:hypothetical protein
MARVSAFGVVVWVKREIIKGFDTKFGVILFDNGFVV